MDASPPRTRPDGWSWCGTKVSVASGNSSPSHVTKTVSMLLLIARIFRSSPLMTMFKYRMSLRSALSNTVENLSSSDVYY